MGPLDIRRLCPGPGVLVDARDRVVAARCHRARGPVARSVGLLGTPAPDPGLALWLEPCAAVHTVGMRRPIACLFLDADGRVLRVVPRLAPWRSARCAGARAVVEAAPGTLAGVPPGVLLSWLPVPVLSADSDIPRGRGGWIPGRRSLLAGARPARGAPATGREDGP